jgi:hypothetical protein
MPRSETSRPSATTSACTFSIFAPLIETDCRVTAAARDEPPAVVTRVGGGQRHGGRTGVDEEVDLAPRRARLARHVGVGPEVSVRGLGDRARAGLQRTRREPLGLEPRDAHRLRGDRLDGAGAGERRHHRHEGELAE